MLNLIADIEKALKYNCFRSAIGLALTLPDICGQVAFPKEKSVGKRYEKWCDEYLNNKDFITTGTDSVSNKIISGQMCYKLRCCFLHSGNLELNQRQNDSFPHFELRISSSEDSGIYTEPIYTDKSGKITKVVLDLRHLCKVLCNSAKEYYAKHGEKSDFDSHHIEIIDTEVISQMFTDAIENVFEHIQSKNDLRDYNELSPDAKQLLTAIKESQVDNLFKGKSQEEEMKYITSMYELLYGGFITI